MQDLWELVQEEMERRKNMDSRYSSASIFSSKIKCSECGNWYGSKVWHSQDKYRRVVFQCNRKFKNSQKCRTPHLTEDEIKDAFVKEAAPMDQEEYQRCRNELVARYEAARDGYEKASREISDRQGKQKTSAEGRMCKSAI